MSCHLENIVRKGRRERKKKERKKSFAILSTEKKLLDAIDLDTIATDFASRNARRNFNALHVNCFI